MREKVLEFLAEEPASKSQQFNKALSLYRQSKGHNAAEVRFANNLGYSEDRLQNLLYELQKLHGITRVDVVNFKVKAPLAPIGGVKEAVKTAAEEKDQKKAEKGPEKVEAEASEFNQELAAFDVEKEKYQSIKKFAARVSDETGEKPADQKGDTLKAFILEAKKKPLVN
jgi:hypothetical protein